DQETRSGALGAEAENNKGNQGGMNNAPARVYAVGRAGTDPDDNVVTVEFQIHLVPGAALVARAHYRLAPSEMKERQTVISELLRIDHRRSTKISKLRTALQRQVTALQGQVTALQAQVTTLQGQQGFAKDHTQSELPEEAGGSA
nr:putative reverse transcriptase domain-containing protein [Tanacetum cinerariifolium]